MGWLGIGESEIAVTNDHPERSEGSLPQSKDSCRVPHTVGAALHVVAEALVLGADRAPMAVRESPAANALDGCLDQVLARPTLGTHFPCGQSAWQTRDDALKTAAPLMMPLQPDVGLVLRMTLRLAQQIGAQFAIGAGGLVGVNANRVDQRSLRERARRQVEDHRHLPRRVPQLAGNWETY